LAPFAILKDGDFHTGVRNMARKPRIYYPGAIYHLIARGNNKDIIFYDDADKRKYLELLGHYKQKFNFNLYAYVLMNNHCHILAQANEHPPGKFMQGLQLAYTLYFNNRYERVGHVFQQRYKAFLCTDTDYLLQLVCYIHQNPVRAGLPGGLNYPWSSHRDYLRGNNDLVDTEFILSIFHPRRSQALKLYKQRLNEPVVLEEPSTSWREADLSRQETAKSRKEAAATLKNTDAPVPPAVPDKIAFEQLAQQIAAEFNVGLQELLGRSRARTVVHARNRLIFEAVNRGIASKSQLARMLNLDPARITRAYDAVSATGTPAKTAGQNK